jgi:hypothetical protein
MSFSSVEIQTPAAYSHGTGMLRVRHEEEAIAWMWAFPQLAYWPRPIEWLYAPVVGNQKWPGDLWGVDNSGDLLVVECKQCRRADDPYIDFLEYHRPVRDEFSAIHWVAKFKRHLRDELRYHDGVQERPPGRTGGILPRSNHRAHLRRWPQLASMIDERIRAGGYVESVMRNLNVRAKNCDPTPHFLALMVLSAKTNTVLTGSALKSADCLQVLVGPDHVGAVAVSATHVSGRTLELRADRFPPVPSAMPVSALED